MKYTPLLLCDKEFYQKIRHWVTPQNQKRIRKLASFDDFYFTSDVRRLNFLNNSSNDTIIRNGFRDICSFNEATESKWKFR